MCKMTRISVRLNLKNFILISCAVLELLSKVSQGAESAPLPDEIGCYRGISKNLMKNLTFPLFLSRMKFLSRMNFNLSYVFITIIDQIPISALRNVYLKNTSDKVCSLVIYDNAELIHCVMRFSMYFITFKEYTLIAILS